MRALIVLIKKQLADDAVYFLIAAGVSCVPVLMVSPLAFFYPENFPLHIFTMIAALPALFGAACFAFGIAHSEQSGNTESFVVLLPVRPSLISLARIVSGTLVVMMSTVILTIAITGGILCKLLLWPESLFPCGLIDLIICIFSIGIACYLLGLCIARQTKTFTWVLSASLLGLILSLLIVMKGPTAFIFYLALLFIAASLICLLGNAKNRGSETLAKGFMTMTLLGIPGFWCRYVCDVGLIANLPRSATYIQTDTSDLLVRENGDFLNSTRATHADARIDPFTLPGRFHYEVHYILASLGIIDYIQTKETYRGRIDLRDIGKYRGTYFDQAKGLVVYRGVKYELYAGPQGMSKTPDKDLGRFVSPIICSASLYKRIILFDQCTNHFFAINTKEQIVRKGTKLTPRPIDIIGSKYWSENDVSVYLSRTIGGDRNQTLYGTSDFLLVVYESGIIDLLDSETLEILGSAGSIPQPRTLFGRGSGKPKHLLAYDAALLSEKEQHKYVGMAIAILSQQGTSITLAVFDKDGRLVKTAHSEANFFKQPWGPALTVGKYVFESLHPPVLTLASFFTAYSFDARSAHRALFLMPNSFVAMARDYQGNLFYMFVIVLLLMLPALLLAGILAWRVDRDAAEIGLSPNARRFWLIGTLCFGLVGYITYRLTRPSIALVTCANCGNPRRPDMEKCHRCGCGWHVPEIIPPAWRVIDG